MILWFFFPLSGRYFFFIPGPQISSLDPDLSSVQSRYTLCLWRNPWSITSPFHPSERHICHHQMSRVRKRGAPMTTQSQDLISLAEQPFFWCPPPTWRPNPPLLHVYSYHPRSCHHHFLPVIAFHTSTSTLYDPIYFMFPNTDEQIF